jgi:uncharacterized protein (DUF2062 family)
MVFKRRKPLSILQWVREGILPRAGWRRVVEYLVHRLRRLPDSPHKISLGIACGVFTSFSPFFGLHIIVAMGLAWILRGNVLASAIGTFFGNPITFPFIAYISLEVGRWLTGAGGTSDFGVIARSFANAAEGVWLTTKSFFGYGPSSWDRLAAFFYDLFLPYLIGGIIPGLIGGVLAYYLSRPLVRAYQTRRREKKLKRIAARTAAKQRIANVNQQTD